MSEILDNFRKRGIRLRRTPAGKLEVWAEVVTDELKSEIQMHKQKILAALDEEARDAAARSEEKAAAIVRESQRKPKYALATEETEGFVFVACKRRDGSGWTISVPAEEWDPFRLAATLASAAPEKISR